MYLRDCKTRTRFIILLTRFSLNINLHAQDDFTTTYGYHDMFSSNTQVG